MFLKSMTLLCMSLALAADAHELREAARGLAVSIEDIDGEVGVNGLPVKMARATGSDVPVVAERLVQRWRTESGTESIRLLRCCGWTIASRIHAGQSAVVQWRPTPAGDELIWSLAGLTSPARAAPSTTLPLPADCRWNAPIHGRIAEREFLQLAARCDLDARSALALMTRRLASEGWFWTQRSALVVQAERGRVQARLTAVPTLPGPGAPGSGSTLVLVESRPVEGARP